MNFLKTFEENVSPNVNPESDFYTAVIGDRDKTPLTPITQSSDINKGGIANEVEYARVVADYLVGSLSIDGAEGDELDDFVTAYVDLPRATIFETDTQYRTRFRALVVQDKNPRRSTKWAIRDAVSYFLSGTQRADVIEIFDVNDLYFELRITGSSSTTRGLTLDSSTQGFLDYNFLGGLGIGPLFGRIGDIVDRIKTAGVDYDIQISRRLGIERPSAAVVGGVQLYRTADVVVLKSKTVTKTSDAEVTT